jgi:hypothetical protein
MLPVLNTCRFSIPVHLHSILQVPVPVPGETRTLVRVLEGKSEIPQGYP